MPLRRQRGRCPTVPPLTLGCWLMALKKPRKVERYSTSTRIPQLVLLSVRGTNFVTCSKTEIKTHQATGDYELYQLSNRTNNQ